MTDVALSATTKRNMHYNPFVQCVYHYVTAVGRPCWKIYQSLAIVTNLVIP